MKNKSVNYYIEIVLKGGTDYSAGNGDFARCENPLCERLGKCLFRYLR